jgi:acyl-coenzyme A synthetase/AMP-(fatty) acid ligase
MMLINLMLALTMSLPCACDAGEPLPPTAVIETYTVTDVQGNEAWGVNEAGQTIYFTIEVADYPVHVGDKVQAIFEDERDDSLIMVVHP